LDDDDEATSDCSAAHRQMVLRHQWRFYVEIHYMPLRTMRCMRNGVRRVVEGLRRLQNPGIEFLHLRGLLGTKADRDRITLRSDEVADGEDAIDCAKMLRTWLGRLRNVKEIVVETEDDEYYLHALTPLKEVCQGGEPERQDRVELYDAYDKLVRSVEDNGFCRLWLLGAARAVEDGDVCGFKVFRSLCIQKQRHQGCLCHQSLGF
jgi:hypothetical protein